MTTTEIRPEQHLTILKHLAAGKGLEVVASIMQMDREVIRQIAQNHGYPDREKLAWAADVVAKNIEDAATDAIPKGTTVPPRPTPAPVGPTSITHPTATSGTTTIPSKPDEFRVLINTAKNHDRKSIQRLAEKILDDLAKLRGLIDAEREAFAARQAAERERAEAKAEVARLEKALADAKAKLRGPAKASAPSPSADGPSAAEIRAWAHENHVEVPAVGRVPKDVREAYDEQHQQAS